MSEELLGRPRSSLEVVISQELPGSRELLGCPMICLWLFFVSLPPSQDLAGRLATGFNRLGVGVLVGPQFKINDGNTTESLRPAYTVA